MNDAEKGKLAMHLIGHHTAIKDVTVTFENGETVSGWVKKVAVDEPMVLCRHSVDRDENPYIELNMGTIASVVVTHRDGAVVTFPA